MIIDSHVHFCGNGDPYDPDAGVKLVRNAMRAGIGVCVASHVITTGPDGGAFPSSAQLRAANDFAAVQVRKNPGRLCFLVYLNPQNPDWELELERGIRNGAVGVKLWVALKNADGTLEETEELDHGRGLQGVLQEQLLRFRGSSFLHPYPG